MKTQSETIKRKTRFTFRGNKIKWINLKYVRNLNIKIHVTENKKKIDYWLEVWIGHFVSRGDR